MNSIELDPHLIKSIGWTLLHSLWQGAVIFAVLVVLLAIFRNKSPQLRYMLSCVSLLILTGWMGFTFISYLPDPDLPLTGGENLEIHEFNNTPVKESTSFSFTVDWRQNMRHKLETFVHLYARQLVWIWLLGAFIFAARWLGGLYFTYRLRSVQTLEIAPEWQDKARRLAKKLGVRRPLSLLESAKVDVPLIIGHLKPVILLPIGMLGGLTPQQVEVILVHEMAHIRRYDFLINLLLSSLEILLFYHPIFWWISNKIMQEREQCCDDLAIKICGNARFYARTLLMMEEKRQQKSLAMAYQGKKHHLLQRVKRICLSSPATYRREFGKAGLALGLLLVLAVATWARMPAELVTKEAAITLKETNPKAVFTSTVTQRALPDTILLAEISSIASRLSLPASPEFLYSLKNARKKLKHDRLAFRQSLDQYRLEVKKWETNVRTDYIGVWEKKQWQIQKAYDDWKEKLERLYNKADYAAALNKDADLFEEAVIEYEEAIAKAVKEIKEGLEKNIQELEEMLAEYESKQDDYNEQMAVYQYRMAVHALRISVHESRINVHRMRLSFHNDRLAIQRDKIDAYQTIMTLFKEEFFAELAKDGLIQAGDKNLEFVAQEGKVEVNGRALFNQDADKYLRLASSFGFKIPKDGKQLILVLTRVKSKKDKKARKSSDKKALKKGKKQSEITLALSVAYKASGKKKKKKRPKMTKAQKTQLHSILYSGAEAYGFQGDFWTEKRVSRVIKESFNIKMSAKKSKKILKKLCLKKPKYKSDNQNALES